MPAELVAVARFLDDLLDVSGAEDRQGNGLAVSSRPTVSRIAAAVNTSFESIRGAEGAGVDLLLVHHTSWRSIDLHLTDEKFALLKQLGISLYAAHEALDRSPVFGTAAALARLLDLEIQGRWLDGTGVYCHSSPASFEALVELIRDRLKAPVESWKNNPGCRRVAILPGAAGMTTYLQEARALGCDTFLTGEGSLYIKLFTRETGMNLVFGGHTATEFPGIRALAARIGEEFGLPWTAIEEDPTIR
jgi:putative NIF3 family GTP cyclohydrolase 1 type 2